MEAAFYIGGTFLGLAFFGLLTHFRSRQIANALLENEHLLELTENLIHLREQEYTPASPPYIVSSKGLLLTYMRDEASDNDRTVYLHHWSLASSKISWNPQVQKGLVSFLCAFLGESPPTKAQISNQDVLHFTFLFDDVEKHEDFVRRQLFIPDLPKAMIDHGLVLDIETINVNQSDETISETEAEHA